MRIKVTDVEKKDYIPGAGTVVSKKVYHSQVAVTDKQKSTIPTNIKGALLHERMAAQAGEHAFTEVPTSVTLTFAGGHSRSYRIDQEVNVVRTRVAA
jgi:hypothetical protein